MVRFLIYPHNRMGTRLETAHATAVVKGTEALVLNGMVSGEFGPDGDLL